jgi:hypothetical protein
MVLLLAYHIMDLHNPFRMKDNQKSLTQASLTQAVVVLIVVAQTEDIAHFLASSAVVIADASMIQEIPV